MATPSRITSRQNQRVKDAVRLRTRRNRDRHGLCLIDGAREIVRAIGSGVTCVEAFVCDPFYFSGDAREAVTALATTRAELLYVSPEVYEKLCFGEREEGVVVVAEIPRRSLSDLDFPSRPLVAVVEGVEKPGNLGAILRSADAAGVDVVIVAEGRTDLFNPNTIRASLGTVFRDNVCETSSAEVVAWLQMHNLAIVAARPDADPPYTEADLRGGVAIVLGSEAAGLSRVWGGTEVQAVRLPMDGIADSLNVSATAAVLFYEARRQRENA
jgi:RNA methyltransferase, TrmH family